MKDKNIIKSKARQRRHWIIKRKVTGTPDKPRLVVFRSLKNIYAQLVDDTAVNGSHTLVTVSTGTLDGKGDGKKTDQSFKVGLQLGEKAQSQGISRVCFDRCGYRYHGRVKAVADGARKAGLVF